MAGFTDAMAIDGKAIVRKLNAGKNLKKGKAVNLEQQSGTKLPHGQE